MNILLLDTDVVSALRRPQLIPPETLTMLREIDLSDAALSAITIEEIERGVLLIERKDAAAGKSLRRWFEDAVVAQHEVLPISTEVARTAARLHVPDPRPYADALIAATAAASGRVLVTGNASDHPEADGLSVMPVVLS